MTIPFSCNVTAEDASTKARRAAEIPQRNMTEYLLSEGWEEATKFAEQCYEDNEETGKFLSSAFVARDMVEIVNALNEDGMLRYWGVSYGTLLGQTFAAMFPEKVDRMFLDSVISPHDYMTGFWSTNLVDADKSLDNFFKECLDAPELCSLANLTETGTTEELHTALANVLVEVWESQETIPVGQNPLVWLSGIVPATLYGTLKRSLFIALYSVTEFPVIDATMASVFAGNFSILDLPQPAETEPETNSTKEPFVNLGVHSFFGIACSDARVRAERPQQIVPYVEAQEDSSRWADAYLPQMWACPAWKFEPAERYEGDFKAKTKNPILFVNGIHDPITPMAAAKNASAAFEGSALLTHKGAGHLMSSQRSKCTEEYVRQYFFEGTLPEDGTECEPDLPAFAYAFEKAAEMAETRNAPPA